MRPVIHVRNCVSEETLARNLELSPVLPEPVGSGSLAVVGGGLSARDQVDWLREWPGDIWAINGTWRWCRDHGIDATFMSIDPQEDQVELVQGVERAVLAAHTTPGAFEALKDAEVYSFRYDVPGPTSAVAASLVALKAGYDHVTYFGCEGSFGATTHTFKDEPQGIVRVVCGGEAFLTKLEFIIQAEQIAGLVRRLPEYFSEESGGLLRALVEHEDWDMTHHHRDMPILSHSPFPPAYGAVFG